MSLPGTRSNPSLAFHAFFSIIVAWLKSRAVRRTARNPVQKPWVRVAQLSQVNALNTLPHQALSLKLRNMAKLMCEVSQVHVASAGEAYHVQIGLGAAKGRDEATNPDGVSALGRKRKIEARPVSQRRLVFELLFEGFPAIR